MRPFVGNLTNVARAVIESQEYAKHRDLSSARDNDDLLSRSKPWEQWYLNAAKLRADWRIVVARENETGDYATEALVIIDEVISLRQDIDFYGMRMAAAFLADDFDAVVETARRMVWLMRDNIKFRREEFGGQLSIDELVRISIRLDSIQTGLSVVRDSGRIADYKFVTLDESITGLRRELESAKH